MRNECFKETHFSRLHETFKTEQKNKISCQEKINQKDSIGINLGGFKEGRKSEKSLVKATAVTESLDQKRKKQ